MAGSFAAHARAVGHIDNRVAALLAARAAVLDETNATLSAHRADVAGFDGDPRLRRDLPAAWPRLRATATAAITAAFDGRVAAVRALRHAAAACDDMEAIDLEAIGAIDAGIADLSFTAAPASHVAELTGFEAEPRAAIVRYWSRDDLARRGQPALADAGVMVWVDDSSDRAVEAALTLPMHGSAARPCSETPLISPNATCGPTARYRGRDGDPCRSEASCGRARRRTDDTRMRALELQVGAHVEPGGWQRWASAYRRAMSPRDRLAVPNLSGSKWPT